MMLLLALIAPIAVGGAVWVHRAIHGGKVGLTPLGAYCAAWITMILLDIWNPLELYQPEAYVWTIIGVSFASFVFGYVLAMLGYTGGGARGQSTGPHLEGSSVKALSRLWLLLVVAASVLFAVYLQELATSYGWDLRTLYRLRTDLAQGSVPTGFYYFLLAEPIVPISVVLALLQPDRRRVYVVTAFLATVSLLATSGRTNATYALLWALCAFALYNGPRLIRSRSTALAIVSLLAAFGIFQLLGTNLGKTYENSSMFARYGSEPPIPAPFVIPYVYIAGPIPTFNAIVRHTDRLTYGKFTFRPVFQALAAIDQDIKVPPLIQQDELIPDPHNVATYLSAPYRDFGFAGILFGPLVIGFFTGVLYRHWRSRPSPATLCLAGFVVVLAISSIGELLLLNLSRIVQLSVLLLILACERQSRVATGRRAGIVR